MFSRLTNSLVLVAAIALVAPSAEAVNCGVCAPSIFYQGLTRTLTLQWETSGNTVQCKYALNISFLSAC